MDWNDFIEEEKKKDYLKKILDRIKEDRKKFQVFPHEKDVFKAFDLLKFDELKVVILGQDPYHTKGKADGLAFSVNYNESMPPSIRNIYKELGIEFHMNMPTHANLTAWAKRGVLLLNTALSVIESKPASHSKIGWSEFVKNVIEYVNKNSKGVVYILLGKHANSYAKYIDEDIHFIVSASHPSSFSANRGFFESNIFKSTNMILTKQDKKPINWSPYQMIVFDLDGTILNTAKTLKYVVNKTLEKFGIEEIEEDKIIEFIGNGAKKLLERVLIYRGVDLGSLDTIFSKMQKEYIEAGTYLTEVYPEVIETLIELKKHFILGVYTNKPEAVAKKVVKEFFYDTFDFVLGNNEKYLVKPSVSQLEEKITDFDIDNLHLLIYVGDSVVDMYTGLRNNMKTIAVNWGYEDIEEIKKLKPHRIISNFSELLSEIGM